MDWEVSTTFGASRDQAPRGRGSVLVVDDDRHICDFVAFVLRSEGYDCEVTESFRGAKARLTAGGVDVCLCDLQLGSGRSGLDLAAYVEGSGVALVIMSGSDDTMLAEEASRIGAYDHLVKPFRNSELVVTVADALQRRLLEQAAGALRRELEQTVARRT